MVVEKKVVAVLPGDGIGPEIMAEALRVARAVEAMAGFDFDFVEAPFGAQAYFDVGEPFPEATKKICDEADVILKGPVGVGPDLIKDIPVDKRPERGALLPLRHRYDTFANYRPVVLPPVLEFASPLRKEVIGDGIDILMLRELTGGIYFGKKERGMRADGKRYAIDVLEYDEDQIRRIAKVAFEVARSRRKVLHNIHKNNILHSGVLWCEVVEEVATEYPDVELIEMIVDATATALCLNPCQFDVMLLENMQGDILSDQGGGLLGSLGLMPSACMGPQKGYFEPSHGSAPDIAGKGIANPYSMIGSVAMMFQFAFGKKDVADRIWKALFSVYENGYRTADLKGYEESSGKIVGTKEFGDLVAKELE